MLSLDRADTTRHPRYHPDTPPPSTSAPASTLRSPLDDPPLGSLPTQTRSPKPEARSPNP
eukprot:3661219-Rhodomonas_salina.2